MKDGEKQQPQLQTLAGEALKHYEGIMSTLSGQMLYLLKRYSFAIFGKGLGLEFPKAIKPFKQEEAGKCEELLYSYQFKRVVVYLIAREKDPLSRRHILKQLSRSLHIPKCQLQSWLYDPSLAA